MVGPCGRKCLAYRADARVAAANSVAKLEMVHANIFMSPALHELVTVCSAEAAVGLLCMW